MGKPVVLRSVEDESGDRCFDILDEDGAFSWVECRRDPEDKHGWRRIGPLHEGFGTADAAEYDARATLGWP